MSSSIEAQKDLQSSKPLNDRDALKAIEEIKENIEAGRITTRAQLDELFGNLSPFVGAFGSTTAELDVAISEAETLIEMAESIKEQMGESAIWSKEIFQIRLMWEWMKSFPYSASLRKQYNKIRLKLSKIRDVEYPLMMIGVSQKEYYDLLRMRKVQECSAKLAAIRRGEVNEKKHARQIRALLLDMLSYNYTEAITPDEIGFNISEFGKVDDQEIKELIYRVSKKAKLKAI